MTDSILLMAFVMVSLGREAITSLIFHISKGGSVERTGRKWKRKKNYGKDVEKKKEKKAKCKEEDKKEFMM
jgi:hypothetical protein